MTSTLRSSATTPWRRAKGQPNAVDLRDLAREDGSASGRGRELRSIEKLSGLPAAPITMATFRRSFRIAIPRARLATCASYCRPSWRLERFSSMPPTRSSILTARGTCVITSSSSPMAIDSYKMLPLSIVKWMASILPWFELLLGGLLDRRRRVTLGRFDHQRATVGIHRRDDARQNSGPGNQLRFASATQ